MRISDIQKEIDLQFKRVDVLIPEIKSFMPLTEQSFENIEIIKTIDSFIYRFIKIQDKIGDKLIPLVLDKLQEYRSNMPFIDMLNKLEKLELIKNTDDWISYRQLRNTLTHDYPDNTEEIIESVRKAIEAYDNIKEIYRNLISVQNRS